MFRPRGGDLAAELPRFLHPDNLANLRVLTGTPGRPGGGDGDEDGDAPILAHAGYLPRTACIHGRRERVACIGAVFVVPEMRGKGLGTLVLEEILRLARRDAELVMVSGDRGLYRRQGLQAVSPLMRVEPPPESGSQPKIRTRDATANDIDRLIAMHDSLDVRFERSASDWHHWLAARPLLFLGATARIRLIERPGDQAAVAYVVTALGRRAVVEYAGESSAVLDAARASGEAVWVRGDDVRTLAEASARGWRITPQPFAMTAEARLAAPAAPAAIPWYGLDYL